jgi:acylphosphatase
VAAVHWKVTGVVQGVGFRWYARVAARRFQLAGWVMNRADGSVEIAASGREEKIAEFRSAIERGPDGAVVSQVEELEPFDGELDFPFSMRR